MSALTPEDPLDEMGRLDAIERHRTIVHNAENGDKTREQSRDALVKLHRSTPL